MLVSMELVRGLVQLLNLGTSIYITCLETYHLESYEILTQVPEDLVKSFAAGKGRSAPNALPAPTGRISLSLNPFRMIYQIMGPYVVVRQFNFLNHISFLIMLR